MIMRSRVVDKLCGVVMVQVAAVLFLLLIYLSDSLFTPDKIRPSSFGGRDDGEKFDRPDAGDIRSVITFNTALTPRMKNYRDRRRYMVEELAASNADLICLQEVWLQEDLTELVEALRTHYPYSFSFLHTLTGDWRGFHPETLSVACDNQLTAVQNALSCIADQCLYTSHLFKSVSCMSNKCLSEMKRLSIPCVACLVFREANTTVSLARCQEEPFVPTHGLLLLSRKPLHRMRRSPYFKNTMIFSRGYLRGYHSETELSVIMRRMQDTGHPMIMGDFNIGPTTQFSKSAVKKQYSTIFKDGVWADPFLGNGQCTLCADNPNLITHSQSKFIDHILIKRHDLQRIVEIDRVFVNNLANYSPNLTFPLSDHYGLKIRLKRIGL